MDTKSRDPIPGLPGSLPKLENATRDLFRLSGGQSIPVEARLSAEPSAPPAGSKGMSKAPSVPAEPPSSSGSGRKQEASIIFSLEALMKSAAPAADKSPKDDEIDQQLWDMHAVTPIFGTAQDQALLTTPLEPPPRSSSVDSMTVSSHQPRGRRWPLLLALGAGAAVALGGFGFWSLRSSASAPSIPDRTAETERIGTGDGVASAAGNPGSPASNRAAAAAAAAGDAPAVTAKPSAASAPPGGNVPAETPAPATAAPTATAPASGATPVVAANPGAGEATPGETATATKPGGSPSSEEAAPKEREKEPKAHAALSRTTHAKAAAKLEPFDKSAALSALNAAATKAESCPHTAGGKGKVQLTFGTNGKVSSAEIVEGPFAASTPAGKCALRHFHAAKVPPFSGSAVTVAKSFKLP